jgi:regulator of sigma E protease
VLPSPSILMMVLAFLLVLGPLVLVHELGHYLVGRWFGIKADAFSIGFGKELLGWTDKRGTRWKISALPLGGYVQFAGDMNAASQPDGKGLASLSDEERGYVFHAKPLWQRALVVLAGPLTNLIVAIAIFASFNYLYGKVVASPVIAGFTQASAARDAGLKVGDRIIAIDGQAITRFDQVRERVIPYPGHTIAVLVERAAQRVEVNVPIASHIDRDQFGNEAHIGVIGIGSGKYQIVPVGPVEAVTLAGDQSFGIVKLMITGIKQIVVGERSVKELGGPLKIAKFSGEKLALGWPEFVYFAALISINLAFINLLPIPGLDGGHLAFYAAEAVRRKPLGARSQEWAFRTGMAFVLALMLFVTINDVASLFKSGG